MKLSMSIAKENYNHDKEVYRNRIAQQDGNCSIPCRGHIFLFQNTILEKKIYLCTFDVLCTIELLG